MTDTVSETEVSFEVWQDGDMVVAADSLADAEHFMLVYGQDGPVEAKTAITARFLGFNVVTAMLAASPQGEGSSADAHPPQPDALPGDLREKIAAIIDANKYEAWTVDRANQMADAILSLIQSERGEP